MSSAVARHLAHHGGHADQAGAGAPAEFDESGHPAIVAFQGGQRARVEEPARIQAVSASLTAAENDMPSWLGDALCGLGCE
ncbi:MAG: hypothetical protein ACR2JO_06735 [Mycobacteriales bacterium]